MREILGERGDGGSGERRGCEKLKRAGKRREWDAMSKVGRRKRDEKAGMTDGERTEGV